MTLYIENRAYQGCDFLPLKKKKKKLWLNYALIVFIGCFFTTIGLNGLESLMKMIKHILREMEQNKLDSGSGNFSSDSGSEARAGVGSEDGLGSKDE